MSNSFAFAKVFLPALGVCLGLAGCATLPEPTSREVSLENAAMRVIRLEVPLESETLLDRYAVGTGFLWNSQGLGVTCAHVVKGAAYNSPIRAYLNGKEFHIVVLNTDEVSDVAVFRLTPPPSPKTCVALSKTKDIFLGEPVYALGFPLSCVIVDKRPTVTAGIVSATDRVIHCPTSDDTIEGLIQVDTVASDGNSGSPVLNQRGEIAGMIVFAASGQSAEWRGAAFALPMAKLEPVVESLLAQTFKDSTNPSRKKLYENTK